MEIFNGYYTMSPDKWIQEIENEKESLDNGEIESQWFNEDLRDIRQDFYEKCYEEAERRGYIHRCWMAQRFMTEFDKLIGISNSNSNN